MDTKKFLIWIDILGFEELIEEIGKRKGLEERKIRDDFVDVVEAKISEAIKKEIIIGKSYDEKDGWILYWFIK